MCTQHMATFIDWCYSSLYYIHECNDIVSVLNFVSSSHSWTQSRSLGGEAWVRFIIRHVCLTMYIYIPTPIYFCLVHLWFFTNKCKCILHISLKGSWVCLLFKSSKATPNPTNHGYKTNTSMPHLKSHRHNFDNTASSHYEYFPEVFSGVKTIQTSLAQRSTDPQP